LSQTWGNTPLAFARHLQALSNALITPAIQRFLKKKTSSKSEQRIFTHGTILNPGMSKIISSALFKEITLWLHSRNLFPRKAGP
jgi:hypothetical protein